MSFESHFKRLRELHPEANISDIALLAQGLVMHEKDKAVKPDMINRDIDMEQPGGVKFQAKPSVEDRAVYAWGVEDARKRRERREQRAKFIKITVYVGIALMFAVYFAWAFLSESPKAETPPGRLRLHGPVTGKFIVPGDLNTNTAGYVTVYSDSLKRRVSFPMSWNYYGAVEKDTVVTIYYNLEDLER